MSDCGRFLAKMSTAYAPQQQHGPPGPMPHNGPPHQGGPPPPQHSAPGPGMPPPQHGGNTPNGVPMGPQRAPSHPGQQNPQNIQRVSTFCDKVEKHKITVKSFRVNFKQV